MAEILKCPECGAPCEPTTHLNMEPGYRYAPAPSEERRREALEWYAEKAKAAARYMSAEPPKAEAMTAVLTELALDGGNRARTALSEPAGPKYPRWAV